MKKLIPTGLILYLFLSASLISNGQSLPDTTGYQRAERFTSGSIGNKVYHLDVSPNWFDDSSGFAYHTYTRSGIQYYIISLPTLKKQIAFNRARLRDSLEKMLKHPVAERHLPLEYISWKNKTQFSFTIQNKKYLVNLKDYRIKYIQKSHRALENSAISPDGCNMIYLKGYNLYLKNLKNDAVAPLSLNGSKYYIYGSYYGWDEVMKGEGEGPAPQLTAQWSPDSKKILTQIMDARKGEKMYLLNWSIDTAYRPLLLSYYRSSPGDSDDVNYIPVIYNADNHKMIKIDLPPLPHYLGVSLYWTKDSKHLYGLYYHRGYKKLDIIEVDPETGKVRAVFTDSSKTYIDYNRQFRYLEAQGMAFITSEKNGWDQIYRIDWNTGNIYPVTHGNYIVKNILSVDTAHKEIYFTASGKEKRVNPYFNSLYKIHFDGSDLTPLTPEPVNHEVFLSPDDEYFVDNRSTAAKPTISLLRSAKDGRILMRIDSADIKDLLAMGWHHPQIFTAIARDGKTTIYGALWKPTNFDPHHRYPLIDYSYTGPQASVFPNTFSKGLFSFYSSAQALAELGFIVMQVDGLGSAGRSKTFHNWSYENMGDNLKDHVLSIKQLGRKYSWIDTTRVGIYGHSAGGYDAAHALMAFNHCYKVAVSESGDHDWRIEKAWWPEMYAGWPVDSVYQQQSNITMAPAFRGKLLLIHGGIDENVNPMETFKLCEALIKAGKYFDLLIIPSAHHGYPAAYQSYVTKKRWHYFVQNLIANPPQ